MLSVSDSIAVSLIAAISGLGSAVIIALAKRKNKKDPMDTFFNGFDRLMTRQNEELERKEKTIESLEAVVDRLEAELQKTRDLLSEARIELAESRVHNTELKEQLDKMRRDYHAEPTVIQ